MQSTCLFSRVSVLFGGKGTLRRPDWGCAALDAIVQNSCFGAGKHNRLYCHPAAESSSSDGSAAFVRRGASFRYHNYRFFRRTITTFAKSIAARA